MCCPHKCQLAHFLNYELSEKKRFLNPLKLLEKCHCGLEERQMNSIGDRGILIGNNSVLSERGAVIIYPRMLIIYMVFVLVLSGIAFAAGYARGSNSGGRLINMNQTIESRREFAAKNEKPNNSALILKGCKE